MFSYVKFSIANVMHIVCGMSKICFLGIEKIVHETKFAYFERFLLLQQAFFMKTFAAGRVYIHLNTHLNEL